MHTQVAGGLWAAAWVGCFLSLWWAVVLAYVGAFTVPVTYSMCKPRLQALVKNIRAHTIVSWFVVQGVCTHNTSCNAQS